MEHEHSGFKLRDRHATQCASIAIDKKLLELTLLAKVLFFQLPLVQNDNGNAWCVKYIKI